MGKFAAKSVTQRRESDHHMPYAV